MAEPIKKASIVTGTTEVARCLKDIQCLKVETGETRRLGDFWENASGPVVVAMFRRWG